MRKLFWVANSVVALALAGGIYLGHPICAYIMAAFLPIWLVGASDSLQKGHSLQRNFPVVGHFRWLAETVRPAIHQYFVESNKDGRPFDRERRSIVYQRAKGQRDSLAFGTESRVYESGYEWINHAMLPAKLENKSPTVRIGNSQCAQPYDCSLLNVSAMSYGSLSKNAVLALNRGAKMGHFFHNTGEGGISSYHLENDGDLCWQIGTAYFGARDEHGKFSPERFAERAALPSVKLIEVKLSQGAKPGHGGILPASKLTPEIAAIRGVTMGKDIISPPGHSAFDSPIGLLQFIQQLRQLSGGKPVGFKLCVGRPQDFLGIAKAMLEVGIYPDFITVDGAEGGTGAAPMEFTNSVGTPLKEGLTLVHNTLVGLGLRQHIKIIAAGKIITGFDLARHIALGADVINCARAMMFALGCIQAQRCNANDCPTGVATQDPALTAGLVVSDKAVRVANYQRNTIHSLMDVISAAGLTHPSELRPHHIMRRVSATQVLSFEDIYPQAEPGDWLEEGHIPANLKRAWSVANTKSFVG